LAALIKSESKTDFIARDLANAATLAFILYAATLILAREVSAGITDAYAGVNKLIKSLMD
jgi:hypothetical protein